MPQRKGLRFEVYEDHSVGMEQDRWRFRLVAENGNILLDSGEAYATMPNARRAVRKLGASVVKAAANVVIVDAGA